MQAQHRRTIIAATNPKGKYDEDEDVSVNRIASPLLSRFDLAFVLLDKPDPYRDCVLSTFVLNVHLAEGEPVGLGDQLGRRGGGLGLGLVDEASSAVVTAATTTTSSPAARSPSTTGTSWPARWPAHALGGRGTSGCPPSSTPTRTSCSA